MSLLSVNNLHKAFGSEEIFSDVSFEVQNSDHIGLVGRNGCGKTTLFNILTCETDADGGAVSKSGKTSIGYMRQHVCRNLQRSAFDEVLSVFSPLIKLETELKELTLKIQGNPENIDDVVARQTAVNERYISDGGLTFRARTDSALSGLGFDTSVKHMPVANLSGGQRAKLQLAKLLLCGANLLLLDEPTNHLDMPSVEWLEDFLCSFKNAFIVISHDRYFLDKVTSRTFELKNRRLTVYNGNYSSYIRQMEENEKAAAGKYENTKKEIKRIEGIIEQQRRWNRERNIKTAESKMKAVNKLEKSLEKPESEAPSLNFSFSGNGRSGNNVLSVDGVSLAFGGKTIFENASMDIKRGERVFLIGANGCGKSSLLKTITGVNKPAKGSCRLGVGVDIGYYDQLQEGLNPEKTVIDEIWDFYPYMSQTEIRNALAEFLFRGDDVFKQVSSLSGGEKARVLLLRLMLSKSNFLLLDEPTNHLDIPSCGALENALANYGGTLLIVSHDRYLINKLAERIYVLGRDGTAAYDGNYDDYTAARQKQRENRGVQADGKKKPLSVKGSEYKEQKMRESAMRKEKSQIKSLETKMEKIDCEIKKLERELADPENASDYQKAMDIADKIQKLKEEDRSMFARWSFLAEKQEK